VNRAEAPDQGGAVDSDHFSIREEGSLLRVLKGEGVYTVITNTPAA
jgi:hypothetical protein